VVSWLLASYDTISTISEPQTAHAVIQMLMQSERAKALDLQSLGLTLRVWGRLVRGRLEGTVLRARWLQLLRENAKWVALAGLLTGVGYVGLRSLGFKAVSSQNPVVGVVQVRVGAQLEEIVMANGRVEVDKYYGPAASMWDTVCTSDIQWSVELVETLQLLSAFQVRDYNLLMRLVVKARQWVKDQGEEWGVPIGERMQLVYGSVAKAMEVTEHELAAVRHMKVMKCAELSASFESRPKLSVWSRMYLGVPRVTLAKDLWTGWFGGAGWLPSR